MIPAVPRSIAQLPPEAKRALRAFEAASDAKLRRLARARRLDSDGHVIYPPAEAVGRLHSLWSSPAGLGSVSAEWYWLARRACLAVSAKHKAGLLPWSKPRDIRLQPWMQAADLELQGVVILAILDRFAEGGVSAADRDWLLAAWRKAGLDS